MDTTIDIATRDAWHALSRAGRACTSAPPAAAMPGALRRMLSRALAAEQGRDRAAQLERHYLDVMPRMRVAQLASTDEPAHTLFHTPLVWERLPRLAAAIDRLFAVLAEADVDPQVALGAATPAALHAPTLAALYERTHYGGLMPLLYGYPADLAYFMRSGLDPLGVIDRYLTAPIVHELCHFARDRSALEPPHLDECVAGWLGVYVHREFAYPAAGHDDAIYAAPWLAQVGQAIARAFGVRTVVRAHAGVAQWPADFAAAAARLGWDDWCAHRTLHFLSDTFAPRPWVALALAAGAGRSLAGATLAELAALPLAELALPDDPAFDRAITRDALTAMCLENVQIDGSFRTRLRFPTTIELDATGVTAAQSAIDPVAPRYWLPPAIARRVGQRRTIDLTDPGAIERTVATLA